jgi:hypothetical protein
MAGNETRLRILYAVGVDGEVRRAHGDDPGNPGEGYHRAAAEAKVLELIEAGERNVEILTRKVYFDKDDNPVRYDWWTEER